MAVQDTRLLDKILPRHGGESDTKLRVGVVDAINNDGTVNVRFGPVALGTIIPNVPRLAGGYLRDNDPVSVLVHKDGLLVLGAYGADSTSRVLDSVQDTRGGIQLTTSGTTESNLSSLALGPLNIEAGALCRLDIRLTLQNSVAAAEYEVIVRRDTALSGTVVHSWVVYEPPSTGGYLFSSWDHVPFGAAESALMLYVSFRRVFGTGTLSVYGGANTAFTISRVGSAADMRVIT